MATVKEWQDRICALLKEMEGDLGGDVEEVRVSMRHGDDVFGNIRIHDVRKGFSVSVTFRK